MSEQPMLYMTCASDCSINACCAEILALTGGSCPDAVATTQASAVVETTNAEAVVAATTNPVPIETTKEPVAATEAAVTPTTGSITTGILTTEVVVNCMTVMSEQPMLYMTCASDCSINACCAEILALTGGSCPAAAATTQASAEVVETTNAEAAVDCMAVMSEQPMLYMSCMSDISAHSCCPEIMALMG